jgi:2-amino-4-hydroxy-6-hydroxymethyldihydropteridine diphosphokinase
MPEEPVIELARVFIGLGSNIEPRIGYLQQAVAKLRTIGEIVKISAVYETAPVGNVAQPLFLNAVVEMLTQEGPLDLLGRLRGFESDLGRQVRPRWHEREIDFDILFYDDLVLSSSALNIPHVEIPNRAFVLAPMAELDENFLHPVLHKTVGALLQTVDISGIKRTDVVLA